jgi:DNA (cytosine-5)-methyltransferase 1
MSVCNITTISTFSGCGGSDYALTSEGYSIVWANDIWPIAAEIYTRNLDGSAMQLGGISDFLSFPEADFLVGCYPCQGYSQAGTRQADSLVNYLYRDFDRVLRLVKPKAFIVENVTGMSYGNNVRLLNNQLHRYRLAGYRVAWSILNAKDYGVAQSRRRIFLVGIRSDLDFVYEFPKPTHGPGRENRYLTQRSVIGGMPEWPEGEFSNEPFHWYYFSRKRRNPWNQPSPCIMAHWRHEPLHPSSPPLRRVGPDHWEFTNPGRARRLSYKECALLQGFPATFDWSVGSARERFKAIGNAVPPPLFSAVLRPLEPLWS